MTRKADIDKEFQMALLEIGLIEPWWSKEDGMFVFEHNAYPRVIYADLDKKTVQDGYQRALREFIKERLAGNLSEEAERVTSGRGGKRSGAGRPKGSGTKEPTESIRIPKSIAAKIREIVQVRGWQALGECLEDYGRKIKIPAKITPVFTPGKKISRRKKA
ncbi:MAG: hypothetical protein K2X01_01410 [Cyanobacteria bacterium]|nr:hypothetical protein [Cyanobacteriota bacterium]